jgi:LytS/YehU family sensor histidine kinase
VPRLLFQNRKIQYFASAVLLIGVFSISTHYIEQHRIDRKQPELHKGSSLGPPRGPGFPGPEGRNRPGPERRGAPFTFPPFVNTVILSILILGFDAGLRTMVKWSKAEQERTLLEKENMQNQLAFLRNQVSPHFFMNTLNNIHSLIDVNTEEAKEAIIKLSKLMRHLLYDTDAERVSLAREIEFITSYTNLMKLRFSDKVRINLDVPEHVPEKQIPPLLFTSFVENAFKHGISYHQPSFIDISFALDQEQLIFKIRNSVQTEKSDTLQAGIGLENSLKRLDILYGEKYTLDIQNHNKEYSLKLSIPV